MLVLYPNSGKLQMEGVMATAQDGGKPSSAAALAADPQFLHSQKQFDRVLEQNIRLNQINTQLMEQVTALREQNAHYQSRQAGLQRSVRQLFSRAEFGKSISQVKGDVLYCQERLQESFEDYQFVAKLLLQPYSAKQPAETSDSGIETNAVDSQELAVETDEPAEEQLESDTKSSQSVQENGLALSDSSDAAQRQPEKCISGLQENYAGSNYVIPFSNEIVEEIDYAGVDFE